MIETAWRHRSGDLSALEELHGAFVSLGGLAGAEGSQITALSGLRILLARVEPVLSGLQLANQDVLSTAFWMLISRRGLRVECSVEVRRFNVA